MRLFYAGAELRRLKSSTEWPDESDELRDVLEAFTQAYQDEARGSRVLDVFGAVSTNPSPSVDHTFDDMFDDLDATRLDDTLYRSLITLICHTPGSADFTAYDSDLSDHHTRLSPHVRHIPKVELARATYGTRAKNIRNSFVYFKLPSSNDPCLLCAGQISQIFLHSRLAEGKRIIEPFVVIDQYIELASDHVDRDPYRRFPLLNTRLYYNRFHASSAVVRMADLVSHFAAFVYEPEGIGEACLVARSLDRVRALSCCLPCCCNS